MFNIIPFILIILCFCIIITIVVRKFGVLAALDTESIQAEREARFKERIIGNRIKRNLSKYFLKTYRLLKPLFFFILDYLRKTYDKLIEFKDEAGKEGTPETAGNLDKLFAEATEEEKKDNFKKAEEIYIKIIGKDSRNIKAFRFLGKMYAENKNFNEAGQTLEHALKLAENEYNEIEKLSKEEQEREGGKAAIQLSGVYFDLALVNKYAGNYKEALKNINNALSIEANNPRYLDTKLEISIINKNKVLAEETYEKLSKANPDNQKLAELKEKIEAL